MTTIQMPIDSGIPTLYGGGKKYGKIDFRIREEDEALIQQACRKSHVSCSAMARELLIDWAREQLGK